MWATVLLVLLIKQYRGVGWKRCHFSPAHTKNNIWCQIKMQEFKKRQWKIKLAHSLVIISGCNSALPAWMHSENESTSQEPHVIPTDTAFFTGLQFSFGTCTHTQTSAHIGEKNKSVFIRIVDMQDTENTGLSSQMRVSTTPQFVFLCKFYPPETLHNVKRLLRNYYNYSVLFFFCFHLAKSSTKCVEKNPRWPRMSLKWQWYFIS